jgi:hypothetical protein
VNNYYLILLTITAMDKPADAGFASLRFAVQRLPNNIGKTGCDFRYFSPKNKTNFSGIKYNLRGLGMGLKKAKPPCDILRFIILRFCCSTSEP